MSNLIKDSLFYSFLALLFLTMGTLFFPYLPHSHWAAQPNYLFVSLFFWLLSALYLFFSVKQWRTYNKEKARPDLA